MFFDSLNSIHLINLFGILAPVGKIESENSIFTVTIESSEIIEGESRIRVGKLNLVDLAGSESVRHTGARGLSLKHILMYRICQ